MQNLYSHYSVKNKKELKDHLKKVADNCQKAIDDKELSLSIIKQTELKKLSYLIGIAHDFGKSTTFFQSYLINGEGNGPSHHGFISAILAYLIVKKEYDEKFAMIAYMVVKRHHGNLESPLSEKENVFFDIEKQIKNIKDNNLNKVKNIYNDLLNDKEYKIENILDELEFFISDKMGLNELFRGIIVFDLYDKNEEKASELFLITNLLYSVLIDFDKKEAANINNDYFKGAEKERFDVKKYINKCRKENPEKFDPNKKINKIRNDFFKEVINNPELKTDNYLYSLTAPTGIGKTFASFAFANQLRKISNKNQKIIYCLPYTSIIDQNYIEFEKIIDFNLQEEYREKPTKYLLRHHYLTPLKYKENIDIEKDSLKSKNLDNYLDEKLLLESWESANIVTTFVQLLESIIGNKNNHLKKFHNIINSIIILDEVQNIPVEYYNIVGEILKTLGEKFNTYILLMTATQPEIISGKNVIDLINTNYGEKEIFDRVNLNILNDLKPYTIDDFVEQFEYNFRARHKNRARCKNSLIVCNTITSALEIYKKMNNIFKDYDVYSLTTNLTPEDREKRIDTIKEEIKKDKKVIVVSTQLIEAGVDISFELVYRDFGPLDSIIQVAGRCNRNGKLDSKGEVNILMLENDKGNKFCERIYDKKLLDICKNILEENKSFVDLSQKYFSEIRNEYKRTSSKILNAISDLNYNKKQDNQTPIKDFKLIKEQQGKEDIIICQNEEVENKIERLKTLYKDIGNNIEDREKIDKLIAEKELINKYLAKYRISVYRNQLKIYYQDYNIIKEFKFIKYISYEDQKKYLYDKEKGFLKKPKKTPQSTMLL